MNRTQKLLAPGEVEAPDEDTLVLTLSMTEMPEGDEELRADIAAAISGASNSQALRIRNILEELHAHQVPNVLIHQLRQDAVKSEFR